MANLLNVVDSAEPRPILELTPKQENRWELLTTEQDHGKWLWKHLNRTRSREVSEWGTKIINASDSAVENLLWETYLGTGQLPVPMKERASKVLNCLRETPRCQLTDLMEVTLRLGFIVVPWEYLSEDSYCRESHSMRQAIQNFGALDGRMDVYVICPPTYYSLEKHINSENPNRPIYAGKNEQAFMALKLTLPTLRAMQAQIETLKANQEAMRRDQYSMRDAIERLARGQDDLRQQVIQLKKDVQSQLSQMQEMLAAELRSTTEAAVIEAQTILSREGTNAADRAKAEAILNSLSSMNLKDTQDAVASLQQITFDLLEPLMFALKKGTSLRDRQAQAVLGPCWGPDFDDIIATAVDLKVDKDRRAKAEQMLQVWGTYGKKPSRDEYHHFGNRSTLRRWR